MSSILWTLIITAFSILTWIPRIIIGQIQYAWIPMRKDDYNAKTTVNPDEIELFAQLTDWWDPRGWMMPLHTMNAVRVPLIRDGLVKYIPAKGNDKPLKGFKILEVGCGGGILSEALAKLGATMTGIDPCEVLLNIAKAHRDLDQTLTQDNPNYIATTIEDHLVEHKNYYDAVVASEVLDHITNPQFFVKSCVEALKPGGKIFVTVPNRTWLSRLGVVFIAENIVRMMPKGTHHYEHFITPDELTNMMEDNNCRVERKQGFLYNVLNNSWINVYPLHFMYGLQAIKLSCSSCKEKLAN